MAEAEREINAISDRFAFMRHTIAEAAVRDAEIGYLLECFLQDESDAETGKRVTKKDIKRKLRDFNRRVSFASSETQFLIKHQLVPQDTRQGQKYYERL
jgi:hypothetical protein